MRLAGMCTEYSKKAMPQLNAAAKYHGFPDHCFRWKYHAVSMKQFEMANRTRVFASTDIRCAHSVGCFVYESIIVRTESVIPEFRIWKGYLGMRHFL
jgi:hypothetical protein